MNLWYINEDSFDPNLKKLRSQETVYTIGNGYFCTRGTFEEGFPRATSATLLYGVFDDVPIAREELANTPDWIPIRLFVNGDRFRLDRGTILNYRRTLDMQRGLLSRTVHWESSTGVRLTVTSERFASLADAHVGAIRYSVSIEASKNNAPVDIALRAGLNSAQGNYDTMHWEGIDQGHQNGISWLQSVTKHTGIQLAQTISFTTTAPGFRKEMIDSDVAPGIHFYGQLAVGKTLTTEKIVVMYTSRDGVEPVSTALQHHRNILDGSTSEPDIHSALKIEASSSVSPPSPGMMQPFDRLLLEHQAAWNEFWQIADVLIEGDEKAQIGMRYNLYQLRINASEHDSRYSIAAKGLTGFGYRGHIFHDTEIFMLPFYTYVLPQFARTLLLYRYNLLDAAHEKAASNGYEGAQYPWESTMNGEEATPASIIHPETGEVIPVLNGFLELHITASIAHAVNEYWRITGDDDFMRDYGVELLVNTAMFWASRVEKNAARQDYEITNVIGPDEWHEHVNDNAYTNYMARRNLKTALEAFYWLRATDPEKAAWLSRKLHVTDERLEHWRDIIEHMRLIQDPETGLIEQFDGFFRLGSLAQERFRGRKDSYQAILGMQEVQRYQIVKQADVLML
ncbi:MAG: glycoside hydrolase family 65 protein, partial [Ktedonobacteraceae bacterium]|nr:glycoside hydrolase family 65 protein [Ktedonobacteraceae bacterium]